MQKTFKTGVCVLLLFCLAFSFAGCGTENKESTTPSGELLFKDIYKSNEEITKYIDYSIDWVSSKNELYEDMSMYNLFNLMRVQVDDWPCLIIGKSTLKEIIATVDKANEDYVKNKTQAVIDQRQKEIDDEYNEKKAAAEAKGKEYKKEKKTARTDDISFEKPYSYDVYYSNDSEGLPRPYEPKYLLDPKSCESFIVTVSKYGIPYVTFGFQFLNEVYNTAILQESDWVCTYIEAADLNTFIYGAGSNASNRPQVDLPEYFDKDGRNKAAKKNIRMSGDINFGGDGFNWDSLLTLCNALRSGDTLNQSCSFTRTSDDNFAYYTIRLLSNAFDRDENAKAQSIIYFPYITLSATFDRATQVCLNWTINMCESSPNSSSDMSHKISALKKVNVREYQVDTNDYSSMEKLMRQWAIDSSIGQPKYCAYDMSRSTKKDRGFIGIVSTGLTNVTLEPVINGEIYIAVDAKINNDGTVTGKYVSTTDAKAAKEEKTPEAQKEYIYSHIKDIKIMCCLVDEKDNVVCDVNGSKQFITALDGKKYFVALMEKEDNEYKNVAVVSGADAETLIKLYVNTYSLSVEQNLTLKEVFKKQGLIAVQEYVNSLQESGSIYTEEEVPVAEDPFAEGSF